MRSDEVSAWMDERGVIDPEERGEVMVLVRRLDNHVHELAAKAREKAKADG